MQGIACHARRLTAMLALMACWGSSLGHAGDLVPPPHPSSMVSRIAFGSCNGQDQPSPILETIAATRADVFLFAGDTVYADTRRSLATVADLASAFERLGSRSSFKTLRRNTPIWAIWDDHDFARNDGGAADYTPAMQTAFLDFWQAPADDPRRSRRGLYHARAYGPAGQRLQIIVLDVRSFRDPLMPRPEGSPKGPYQPDPDPRKSMLGAEQWAWLERRLAEPANLRLIVSTIQVLSEGHGWERWGALPLERDRLLALLRKSGAAGVILLSGDRHVGALYRDDDALPYPLLELTSSSLNLTWTTAPPEPGPHIQGDLVRVNNFGLVEVDWSGRAVILSLRGESGEVLLARHVPFDHLGPGP